MPPNLWFLPVGDLIAQKSLLAVVEKYVYTAPSGLETETCQKKSCLWLIVLKHLSISSK